MKAGRFALIAATLWVGACDKSASTTPPTDAPTADAPAANDESGSDTADSTGPEVDEAAKKKAEQEERFAKRLANDEAQAEKRMERWTPELQSSVAALTAKKYRSTKKALGAILKSPHRAPGNPARDAHRHPAKTLDFFGIKQTMRVFEVGQGAGWYTELLAPLLAREGKLFLAGYDASSDDPRTKYGAASTKLFVESHGNLYENVELVVQGPQPGQPQYGENLDMILVARMFHNFHRFKMWDQHLPAMHAALADGGVLAVIQHRAPDDGDADEWAGKGYLPEPWLIEKIESYGFKLEAKSDINANPKDTKDYEKGVWELPPTLAGSDDGKDAVKAIGESDRSTLKFVKI